MKALRILAVAMVAVLAAACSPKKEAAPAAGAPVVIRFATDWKAQAEHGGFYQAVADGEYARHGLDVKIIQGGPGVNVPQLLASGAVEMGMGSNSFIVMNLAQQGVPVKAVAAYMQKDPQVLIAHPDTGVKTIADLKGHPILLSDASVSAFWVWLKPSTASPTTRCANTPSIPRRSWPTSAPPSKAMSPPSPTPSRSRRD